MKKREEEIPMMRIILLIITSMLFGAKASFSLTNNPLSIGTFGVLNAAGDIRCAWRCSTWTAKNFRAPRASALCGWNKIDCCVNGYTTSCQDGFFSQNCPGGPSHKGKITCSDLQKLYPTIPPQIEQLINLNK